MNDSPLNYLMRLYFNGETKDYINSFNLDTVNNFLPLYCKLKLLYIPAKIMDNWIKTHIQEIDNY